MLIRRSMLALPVALAFLGTGCEAEPEEEVAVQTAPPATVSEVAPPAAMGTPGPSPEVTEYGVRLQPLAGSGVSGEGALEREQGQTRVRVQLTGAPGNTAHQGHIHQGASCAAIGGVVAPLQPITTDAQGGGTMTATVAQELSSLMDGNHLIVYHEAGGSPGQPVTCGEIPPQP